MHELAQIARAAQIARRLRIERIARRRPAVLTREPLVVGGHVIDTGRARVDALLHGDRAERNIELQELREIRADQVAGGITSEQRARRDFARRVSTVRRIG